MRKLLSLSLTVLLAGPCLAQEAAPLPSPDNGQTVGGATPPTAGPRPRGKDRGVTQQVFVARHEAALMRADTDGDGRISRDEWMAYAASRPKKGIPERQFARLDANRDGFLDKGEVDTMLTRQFAKRDTSGDGVLTADERQHRPSSGR